MSKGKIIGRWPADLDRSVYLSLLRISVHADLCTEILELSNDEAFKNKSTTSGLSTFPWQSEVTRWAQSSAGCELRAAC